MPLPGDYLERVYAGVLGKIIGVYLGRPVEGWSPERILERWGELDYYVHAELGRNIVETDDDISGTFVFLRALPDNGNSPDITAEQIGEAWLNYLIERRTVLWWGGLGSSSEHTAFMRLKAGVKAPESGSAKLNGRIIAEQIGAQIFIDGWAMVSPGDPERAAELAKRAGSVSHDGEAVYGAQMLAAMEAAAFTEPDIDKLLDTGLSFIPDDCDVRRVIGDLREWRASTDDWRAARERLGVEYPYERFGGGCPMVPNHGVIILSLLYGGDGFGRTLMIANSCGWDTDCNSGNVGCLMGIKNGLAGIDAGADFRGPVADRMLLPCADGGGAITDAAAQAYWVANIGRALAGEEGVHPKGGARFHFSLPGSVQGWRPEAERDSDGAATVRNVERGDSRALAIDYMRLAPGRTARVFTDTFTPASGGGSATYSMTACPTLYPGQMVKAALAADESNSSPVTVKLYHQMYGAEDKLVRVCGPEEEMAPGAAAELQWQVLPTGGAPVARVGVEISTRGAATGTVYLDRLGWKDEPDVTLGPPEHGGEMWRRAWVDGVDSWGTRRRGHHLNQNEGTGLIIQGTREWRNYRFSATVKSDISEAAGIAVRVQGMRRYYAMLLCRGYRAKLVKVVGKEKVLEECELDWVHGREYELALEVVGNRLQGFVGGNPVFDVTDEDDPLEGGAVALVLTEGMMQASEVKVEPAGF